MLTKDIELHGHIIDSLILPKVMDEILARGGQFNIRTIRVGKEKTDPSYCRIEVSAKTAEQLEEIIARLRMHGAEVPKEDEVQLEEAPADGCFPDEFYVTTNKPTSIYLNKKWLDVENTMMDSAIVVEFGGEERELMGGRVDESKGQRAKDSSTHQPINPSTQSPRARTIKFADVKKGMKIVVGSTGVRVAPLELPRTRGHIFEFMGSSVSTEKPKGVIIRDIADLFLAVKGLTGQRVEGKSHPPHQPINPSTHQPNKILVVGGPAIVHTGAGEHFEKLIKWGFVDVLFAGNALAAHDIEAALFGTSLGVYLDRGTLADEGHNNHMRAINIIRRHGSIANAVKAGTLRKGIMYQCVKRGVDYVLAGSVRDDGPLPDVVTDMVEAQRQMREKTAGVAIALMMGTMLHSIATGNMLPATVKTICVDINPSVVTKLSDRGTFQAIGLVTDIEPFLHELTGYLQQAQK
jgi:lysine-ketoglutarate reductase/saccharopine dehydrogenase-like protein (TIGR00300 family)